MNREIKFRAWNVGTKRMVDLKKITPLALNADIGGLYIPESDGIIVMQYTGLKDKSGKEIYEGDIVSRGDGNFVVQYKNDGHYIGYVATMDDKAQSYIHVWYDNIEIIGNIHESPNLLKP